MQIKGNTWQSGSVMVNWNCVLVYFCFIAERSKNDPMAAFSFCPLLLKYSPLLCLSTVLLCYFKVAQPLTSQVSTDSRRLRRKATYLYVSLCVCVCLYVFRKQLIHMPVCNFKLNMKKKNTHRHRNSISLWWQHKDSEWLSVLYCVHLANVLVNTLTAEKGK